MSENQVQEDVQIVTDALLKIVLDRRLPCEIVLLGVEAFLMALCATHHGNAKAIGAELQCMADYFSQPNNLDAV